MSELERIDKNDMLSMTQNFPVLIVKSSPDSEFISHVRAISRREPEGVCLIGMGGSSIAGEICRGLLWRDAKMPIISIRDYFVPPFIDEHWASVIVSYSGNTEETLSAFNAVNKRGSSIVVLTSGGKLAELYTGKALHLLPSGFQPRAALPIIISIVLPIIEILLGMDPTDFKAIADRLLKGTIQWEGINPNGVVNRIKGKIPLFIGAEHMIPVAYRAKCQINENAKAPAFSSDIPESNHNEIEAALKYSEHNIIPIFLRSNWESSRIKKRMNETRSIYEEKDIQTLSLGINSESIIEETLGMIYNLDLASVILAKHYQADPLGVPMISALKKRLAHSKSD